MNLNVNIHITKNWKDEILNFNNLKFQIIPTQTKKQCLEERENVKAC